MSEFCVKCKKLNHCNVDGSSCWCLRYPALHKITELTGGNYDQIGRCMCESCFKKELKKQINLYVERFEQGKVKNLAPKITSGADKPIRDIDYYIEDGRWVFTAWSHMRRGYCCGSGCRHCPYPQKKTNQRKKN